MTDGFIAGPAWLPFAFLVLSLCVVALLERIAPATATPGSSAHRWTLGIGLWSIATLIHNVAWSQAPAHGASDGVFSAYPVALQLLLMLLTIDFAQFVVHLALHRFTWLWTIHATHHSDASFDSATSLRFHPLETLLRGSVSVLPVALFGWPVSVWLAALCIMVSWNTLTHANVRLPGSTNRLVGTLMITPDAHRVHHAREPSLYGSNYGTVFSLWDRLLGTFRAPPRDRPAVGLAEWSIGDDMMAILASPIRSPFTAKKPGEERARATPVGSSPPNRR